MTHAVDEGNSESVIYALSVAIETDGKADILSVGDDDLLAKCVRVDAFDAENVGEIVL